MGHMHDRHHKHDQPDPTKTPYAGPFLDGSTASGWDVAYIDLRAGGSGAVVKVFKPYPPANTINEVLGGNAPEYALQNALANGTYVPSAAVLAAADAFNAWRGVSHDQN